MDLSGVAVFGATGSIGIQTLDVLRRAGARPVALSANSNVEAMENICREFLPKYALMADDKSAADLKTRLSDTNITVFSGNSRAEGIIEDNDVKTVVSAVVGIAGLPVAYSAAKSGKRLCLANKESLVCAGDIIINEIEKSGTLLLPVDSEHCAIHQCLRAGKHGEISSLMLTASGGPFFGKKRAELVSAPAEDALRHPVWNMGQKITIDSATLMNKGLEVIEAMHLFAVPQDKIEVLVHRKSLVHSLVSFCDGQILAQFSLPDMRSVIAYALSYPKRCPEDFGRLDLASCGPIEFSRPDESSFPCLSLAREAAKKGMAACIALNAANEEAVSAYLSGKIGFYGISDTVEKAVLHFSGEKVSDISDVFSLDIAARRFASEQF